MDCLQHKCYCYGICYVYGKCVLNHPSFEKRKRTVYEHIRDGGVKAEKRVIDLLSEAAKHKVTRHRINLYFAGIKETGIDPDRLPVGPHTTRVKKQVTNCFYCEREFRVNVNSFGELSKTRDHIIPVSKGGNNSVHNIVFCCYRCNGFKADLDPRGFRSRIKQHIHDNTTFKNLHRDLLPVILKNTEELILRVQEKKDKMTNKPMQKAPIKEGVHDGEFHVVIKKEDQRAALPSIKEINKQVRKTSRSFKRQSADVSLSVNDNTGRQSQEEKLFLQRQTFEQFKEKQRLNEFMKKYEKEPQCNFHEPE